MMLRSLAFLGLSGALFVAACTTNTTTVTNSGADGGAGGGGNGGGGGAGTDGGGGGAGTDGPALPDGTLLYVRGEKVGDSRHDSLIARDLDTGDERVVTDLTTDGSSGWEIWGYSLSPNRQRIAIASLYGPTKEDTATGLATRAIWTLATDGTDFRRLTPTFPNKSGGRKSYSIDVGEPMWTQDGSHVIFDFGEYWWENSELKGGTFPWVVSAAGGLPSSVPTTTACTVLRPSRNPATGDMLYIHSVCIPGSGTSGLFLYPEAGSEEPTELLAASHAGDGIDTYLATPSWLPDGTGFLFVGSSAATDWTPSVFLYDVANKVAKLLVPAPTGGSVDSVAISPAGKIVYTVRGRDDDKYDLHMIDATATKPTDVALTTDGMSRDPSF